MEARDTGGGGAGGVHHASCEWGRGAGKGCTGERTWSERSPSCVSGCAQCKAGEVHGWVDEDEPHPDGSHGTDARNISLL
jgi:hypothetical protein